MSKPSVFRDFIAALKKEWRSDFPAIRQIKEPLGPLMPKASTFYAGVARRTGWHIFLNFQHSSKAWQAGQFTVNVVFSRQEGAPEHPGTNFLKPGSASFEDGAYRIGPLLGRKDKWWHLKDDDALEVTEAWRPSSYDQYGNVISEAIKDVSRDEQAVLRKLGVTETAVGMADS
jgi:Domain of unknown function (DUF4304)